jgi:uncharacterized protein (DUF983 family)
MSEQIYPPQSSLKVALTSRCPRCGKGKLFSGFLTIPAACEKCDLDFRFTDSGDGPAVFIALIGGGIVVALALITEVKYQPPYWVHAVLWIPLVLILTVGLLRPLKGFLIAQQFKHKAGEGRLSDLRGPDHSDAPDNSHAE